MLVTTGLGHRSVVERLDDLLANLARLETVFNEYCRELNKTRIHLPCKANTPAVASCIAKNPTRAHLVRGEDSTELLHWVSVFWLSKAINGSTYMLIHVLGDVRHIEISVRLIAELLELGVE